MHSSGERPRQRSGGGDSDSARPKLPKPPQGHGGYKRRVRSKPPRREGEPPRYTNLNARELMLTAARDAAEQRGYEAMRISEVTDAVGVTRQAFYAHFRDKRHCLCEAISPKLASIERLAASASEQDAEWAAEIIGSVDEVLYGRFQSADGTRGRIVSAMRELLGEKRSFSAIKIGEIVRCAHVPQGDFYKTFNGKRECFAVAYEQILDETFTSLGTSLERATGGSAEPRHPLPVLLEVLGVELTSDPERLRVLVVEAAQLPEADEGTIAGAWRGSLGERIAELLAESAPIPAGPTIDFLAGSVIEVVRSAVAAQEADQIPDRLASLGALGIVAASEVDAAPVGRIAA